MSLMHVSHLHVLFKRVWFCCAGGIVIIFDRQQHYLLGEDLLFVCSHLGRIASSPYHIVLHIASSSDPDTEFCFAAHVPLRQTDDCNEVMVRPELSLPVYFCVINVTVKQPCIWSLHVCMHTQAISLFLCRGECRHCRRNRALQH